MRVMSKQIVQNKYNPGDVVYAKANPDVKLVIRRYVDRVYYCKVDTNPSGKEQVYFERELVENAALAGENQKNRDSKI